MAVAGARSFEPTAVLRASYHAANSAARLTSVIFGHESHRVNCRDRDETQREKHEGDAPSMPEQREHARGAGCHGEGWFFSHLSPPPRAMSPLEIPGHASAETCARARGSAASATTRMVMALRSPPAATSRRGIWSREGGRSVRRVSRLGTQGGPHLFRG